MQVNCNGKDRPRVDGVSKPGTWLWERGTGYTKRSLRSLVDDAPITGITGKDRGVRSAASLLRLFHQSSYRTLHGRTHTLWTRCPIDHSTNASQCVLSSASRLHSGVSCFSDCPPPLLQEYLAAESPENFACGKSRPRRASASFNMSTLANRLHIPIHIPVARAFGLTALTFELNRGRGGVGRFAESPALQQRRRPGNANVYIGSNNPVVHPEVRC
ncbi:hypothetical protein CYLTODRAFT_262608 [Cylindrobasidium torrendii FP15055 ss-10]|uniref:Uncharacterized protein n=1 Tax=Cylindrobasidium torrendii FP15055 ss-10 TaxID=1314674 RepID=A0A0D7BCW4_9AGAR|nr:hypothetical protein CYLTODRAFT_262608 [Cylindrobasidium torrendii FP15055 ss-10]